MAKSMAKARIGLASVDEPNKYLFFDAEMQGEDEDAKLVLSDPVDLKDCQVLQELPKDKRKRVEEWIVLTKTNKAKFQ